MRPILILILSLNLISCGFKGQMQSSEAIDSGIYALYDDNNWPMSSMIWPLQEATLSQQYSLSTEQKHKGIDLAAPKGNPVRAVLDGVVVLSGVKYSGYGNMVIIKHNDNLMSVYAHLDELHFHKGDSVKQGEVIGTVGDSGQVTGVHLHFEVVDKGYQEDPLSYLDTSKLSRL